MYNKKWTVILLSLVSILIIYSKNTIYDYIHNPLRYFERNKDKLYEIADFVKENNYE
jgi:hypothetical protein